MSQKSVVNKISVSHMERLLAAYDRLSTKELLALKHAKQAEVLTVKDLQRKFSKESSHGRCY